MAKWLDKYEDGGEFLGTTNKGFDYNGAWGGTMQMGGGIPGAVGFTYARVAGAAPSNGPYAKKTKASAQNGMEMKYYQEGLDFKPKTISQNGSEIPQSQFGTMLAPITGEDVSRFLDLFSIPQKAVTKVATGKYQTPSEAFNIKNPVGAFVTDMILDPVNILGGVGLASKSPKATKAIANASKKVTNAIKPSKVVKKLIGKQLNEKLPTGIPASTRALASDATITEEGNRILNRLASPEGKKRLKNQFKLADPQLTDKQLDYLTATRLNEINTAVNYNKSRFYLDYGKGAPGTPTQNVPFTEYLPMENAHFSEINLFPGIRNLDAPVDLFPRRATPPPPPNVSSGKFNLAKPTASDNLKAFADPNYRPGSIALGTGLELNKNVLAHEVMHAIQNKGVTPVDEDLLNLLKPKNTADMLWRAGVRLNPELKDNLKYFTTSGGRSAKSEPLAFLEELRNRMLNRGIIKDDYEKITPGKLAKARLDAVRQVDKNFVEGTRLIKFTPPWKYGKLADIMNVAPATVPVVGAAALLGDEEQPPKQKKGGKVKKDDMGYWNPENWGEPVEIDSNQITMEGVYEPLLGISDTGDTQMMYPGEDYEFDGESVIEYPMNNIPKAQFGIPMIPLMQKAQKILPYIEDFFSPAHSYGNINEPNKKEKVVERKPHEVMNSLYADAIGDHFKTYNPGNVLKPRGKNDTATVNMSTGRFNTAKVPEYVIDAAIESSKKNNYPVGKLLALMGRESMFGVGADEYSHTRKDDKKDLVSAWDVDQEYAPYHINRFLADNKVPGVTTIKTNHGWEFQVDDEKASQDYIDKHPELLEKYKNKLASRKSIAGKDAFDLAIERIKKSGIKNYNPGDKSYEAMYNKDYEALRKDPTLQKYLKSKGAAFENGGWLEKYK